MDFVKAMFRITNDGEVALQLLVNVKRPLGDRNS